MLRRSRLFLELAFIFSTLILGTVVGFTLASTTSTVCSLSVSLLSMGMGVAIGAFVVGVSDTQVFAESYDEADKRTKSGIRRAFDGTRFESVWEDQC